MDRIFMDEYYEHLRADNIEAFSKERNDEYVGRAEEFISKAAALFRIISVAYCVTAFLSIHKLSRV